MDESPERAPREPPRSSGAAPPTLHREDCWSDEATRTLVDAWGERYLSVNRGSLRQQHWQEVADAVNARHGGGHPKSRRTEVQCKYRIDTLKKRYRAEKARVVGAGDRSYVSPWPFFPILHHLIGPQYPAKDTKASPPPPAARLQTPLTLPAVPVRPRSFKRSGREHARSLPYMDVGDVFLRRKYTELEREDSNGSGSRPSSERGGKFRGSGELVKAIKRMGEVYERVERRKMREMVELEKQRMEFAKELELQRMKWVVDMQVQLQKTNKKSPQSTLAGQWLHLITPSI